MDVASSKNRIIERIIRRHREETKPLPIKFLRKARILSVFWDGKLGHGHEAETKAVLDPEPTSRDSVHCILYLESSSHAHLAKDCVIRNNFGVSHETCTTTLSILPGRNILQQRIAPYNSAVKLESMYLKYWTPSEPLHSMYGEDDRESEDQEKKNEELKRGQRTTLKRKKRSTSKPRAIHSGDEDTTTVETGNEPKTLMK